VVLVELGDGGLENELAPCHLQTLNEIGRAGEEHAVAGLDEGVADGRRGVRFPATGRTRRILPDIAAAKRRSITRFTRATANVSSWCAATVGVA